MRIIKQNIIALFLALTTCLHTPALVVFNNMNAGKRAAQEAQNRIFLIFDLWGSSTPYVNHMLRDTDIREALDAYTVVRLRCDDRSRLNDTLTLGDYNAGFQATLTGAKYQPMFCILDARGNLLQSPLPYSQKQILLRYIFDNAH